TRNLGTLLLVARRREDLAGELLRAAHVNDAGRGIERGQDLVALGADRGVALLGGEGGRRVARHLGRRLATLGDPALARAVDQLALVVAAVAQVPIGVGGKPVVAVAVKDDGVLVADTAA